MYLFIKKNLYCVNVTSSLSRPHGQKAQWNLETLNHLTGFPLGKQVLYRRQSKTLSSVVVAWWWVWRTTPVLFLVSQHGAVCGRCNTAWRMMERLRITITYQNKFQRKQSSTKKKEKRDRSTTCPILLGVHPPCYPQHSHSHTHARARTHARTLARTHPRTHTHTHTQSVNNA